ALYGTLRTPDSTRPLEDRMTGVVPLGPVPASGEVTATVETRTENATAGETPIGCLDRTALETAVSTLKSTGATSVRTGGHTLEATLPPNTTGTAVLAVTNIPGWQCSAPIRDFHGLLALPVTPTTRTLSCTFTPKGLPPGLAAAALALLTLTSVTTAGYLRRRRGA
ncbi:hypothetical protein EF912_11665, partial [Streptomyces sp. WAC07061]